MKKLPFGTKIHKKLNFKQRKLPLRGIFANKILIIANFTQLSNFIKIPRQLTVKVTCDNKAENGKKVEECYGRVPDPIHWFHALLHGTSRPFD